ncbi:hypothetical protein F5884DRAFT_750799 [Xylogone sp. PMI_703]|nr:hypothetical protein F5884DRAFT_750799 [Xylogone sp. PMI_703]
MESTQVNRAILRTPHDWENWYRDLKNGILPEIWELVNPEPRRSKALTPSTDSSTSASATASPSEPQNSPKRKPMPKPIPLDFSDYHEGATKFSALNSTEQKVYINAQHIYEVQLKEYRTESQALQEVRHRIQFTVSDTKKALLSPEKSTRKWLRILMEDIKPSQAQAQ